MEPPTTCRAFMARFDAAGRPGDLPSEPQDAVAAVHALWRVSLPELLNADSDMSLATRAQLFGVGVQLLLEVEALRMGRGQDLGKVRQLVGALHDGGLP